MGARKTAVLPVQADRFELNLQTARALILAPRRKVSKGVAHQGVAHPGVAHPGEHDAIIDEGRFEAVQAKLSAQATKHGRGRTENAFEIIHILVVGIETGNGIRPW
jgi:hypothetical protein